MTPAMFSSVGDSIRRAWTQKDGAVALLYDPKHEKPKLRLCVGPETNKGVMAEDCVLWDGDSRVYRGKLSSVELQKLLTNYRICKAEVTSVKDMGAGVKPLRMELGGNAKRVSA